MASPPSALLQGLILLLVGGCSAYKGIEADVAANEPYVVKGECDNGAPLGGNLLVLPNLSQGASFHQSLCIRNPTAISVTLREYTSSCECLKLKVLPAEISAGGSAALEVEVDLQQEANCVGELEINVSVSGSGFRAITFRARLKVEASDSHE